MLIKTQGIVLRHRNIGENDRILVLFTKDLGVIEASARGVKRLKSPLAGATQVLCYSSFCLYQGKRGYTVDSAEMISSFYELRLDAAKLSLAVYFCDLLYALHPFAEKENSWNCLRLLLNSLALLERDKKPMDLLKAIYELRLLSLCGFMPDLVCCASCACYEAERMYFLPVEGKLFCSDCAEEMCSPGTLKYTLPPSVLQAMRHIIYSDDDKVFSFNLTGKSLKQLNFVIENYVLLHADRKFQSLDVYKQMAL
ncbi:MAG: DNA repair protein RecO [Massiliimalia sp.]